MYVQPNTHPTNTVTLPHERNENTFTEKPKEREREKETASCALCALHTNTDVLTFLLIYTFGSAIVLLRARASSLTHAPAQSVAR